jgi:hypothetical protein
MGVTRIGGIAQCSSKAEISQFDFATVVEEDVGALQVAMNDFIVVEILDSFKDLLEDAFHLWVGELALETMESGEIVVHVVEHQEGGPAVVVAMRGFGDDDLSEADDVAMVHHLQQLDFPNSGYREALAHDLRVARIDLLQCHEIVALQTLGLIHLPVST